MIVVFRNYFRNKMVNLTATSVKHFVPDAEFHCFTFYKQDINEYDSQEPLHDWINLHTVKTKYVTNKSDVHDSKNIFGTSGAGNADNGKFFAESFNLIHQTFADSDDVVLCLCEDHFFTTGATLREVLTADYDLCIGPVGEPGTKLEYEANACIMAFRPKQVSEFFPLPELQDPIEGLLERNLVRPLLSQDKKLHKLTTRKWTDYCGDGLYTNSSEEIREEMIKAGIL